MLGRNGRIRAGFLLHSMQARWLLRYVPIQMAGVMGLAPTSSTVTGWTLVSSYSRPANWLPELESHQHPPLQRRLNCCYSIREWWAARDSHPDLTA